MSEAAKRERDIVLLCNPAAGGRWRELAKILDSPEARQVRRIVTDQIGDIEAALADLRKERLVCIYGGDGTIQKIVTEMLRRGGLSAPVAFIGGGTMNLAMRWSGWHGTPGDNFGEVIRRDVAGKQLYTEIPLLEIRQGKTVEYGFTWGAGPTIRVLDRYENGRKGKLAALEFASKAVTGALARKPPEFANLLDNMQAEIELDGERLPYSTYVAIFCNVTGMVHIALKPYNHQRTRDTFHALAYASTAREIAVLLPFLAMGKLPVDSTMFLRPVSLTTQFALSYFGRGALAYDPRYINRAAHTMTIRSDEKIFTIDGEIFQSTGEPIEIKLGPSVRVVAGSPRA